MAADAAIHGSFNSMVHIVKFIFIGWLQSNLVTEPASGSVDGRVRGHECVRDVALSGRWKSGPWEVTTCVAKGNCVAVRRGGEQPAANEQPVG